ncbi:uncharacterized protein LOC111124548 isoform X5 [Crassostrea virginica]
MTSPTGKTPLQVSKKQEISMSNTRSAWSSEEKEFLENYIREAGGVPSKESSLFWKSCAEMLSSHCGTSRTDTPIYSKSRSVGTQTDSAGASTSTETQTFPALPIMKERVEDMPRSLCASSTPYPHHCNLQYTIV